MINPGEYKHKISIIKIVEVEDNDGFKTIDEVVVLFTYSKIKTTKGFTLIANRSDFEQALTNFTIRYPKCEISRDMKIRFNKKLYDIEYLNNVDEENNELEIQAKGTNK